MKKIILGIIFFIFIFGGFSFANWSWKYYQMYTSIWEQNSGTIFNGLINNSLSSSYYINSGPIPSSNTKVDRVEGDVIFVVQENGEFNVLSGLNVTDYNGSSNYFTAYKPGTSYPNYSYTICNTFRSGRILDVYIKGNGIYKNVVAGGQTLKIKIANLSPDFSILSSNGDITVKNSGTLKIKIIDGYTSCADPKSILTYRILYFTRYKQDESPPVASVGNLYLTGGRPYIQGKWINEPVYIRIDCTDKPNDNPQRNSGCKDIYTIEPIPNQITSDEKGLYYIISDRTKPTPNTTDGYLKINVAIDTLKPIFLNNIVNFIGNNDLTKGYNYRLDKDRSEYTILADKYDISFSVKDPGDCNSRSKLCKGVSGIKSIKVLANGNELASKSYPEYNSSKTLVKEDVKNVNLNINLTNIGNSGNKDVNFSIVIEDFAGNTLSRTWNLHIKPNKPYIHNFVVYCLKGCTSSQYSTNETSDYFEYGILIKDRWGNLVTKKVSNVLLTKGSWLDKDTYDGNNFDDGNAIIMYNKNLSIPGKLKFSLRSIVPGEFKREFKIVVPSFDVNYNNNGGKWFFTKTTTFTDKFNQSIVAGELKIYDTSGNIVSLTGLSPTVTYMVKVPINSIGFDNNNYEYIIGDIKNNFIALPSNIYEIIEIKDIKNNKKYSYESNNKVLEFKFKYNFKGGGIINKTVYFNFNPSVSLTNNGNTGKFPLYPNGGLQIGTGEDMRFRFSIIGFKKAAGEMYAIGQGRDQFNMVTSQVKSKIKSNVYKYIRSIPANKVVNGLLIKNGNYEITSSEYNWLKSHNVKTLIVRNGNVIISTNIIKRLDIATFLDNPNYEISENNLSDYLKNGNIIIKPNVTFINGLLYAEKSLLAATENGEFISASNESRSAILKKQLLFYGSIISRNTVGGSIIGTDGYYTLPGGKKTSNLDLASYFDIAFLRLGYEGFNQLPNSKFNDGVDDYVIVRYNPSIKLTPGPLLK